MISPRTKAILLLGSAGLLPLLLTALTITYDRIYLPRAPGMTDEMSGVWILLGIFLIWQMPVSRQMRWLLTACYAPLIFLGMIIFAINYVGIVYGEWL